MDPQQVLTEFNVQLKQNLTRLPNHGPSAIASDLPAAYIQVADGFVMSVTNPLVAKGVAANLAKKYATQSAIFSANAARLTSIAGVTSDPAEVKALLTQAQSYRATAAQFAKVDAAYLLAKYPPGEKIIIIKLGDVRVGYARGRRDSIKEDASRTRIGARELPASISSSSSETWAWTILQAPSMRTQV